MCICLKSLKSCIQHSVRPPGIVTTSKLSIYMGFSGKSLGGLLYPFTEGLPTQDWTQSLRVPALSAGSSPVVPHGKAPIQTSTVDILLQVTHWPTTLLSNDQFFVLEQYTFLLINSLVTNCRFAKWKVSKQGNKQENKGTLPKLGNCQTKWTRRKIMIFVKFFMAWKEFMVLIWVYFVSPVNLCEGLREMSVMMYLKS